MILNQPTSPNDGLRHIASNSLLLFVRMLAIMVINLYAVRLILRGLGVEDYGIYNTVAGLVGLSSFINGVLDVAIQRFYSFYIGKGDFSKVRETFTISLLIVLILSVVVIILFETLGIWAVNTYLVFPIERSEAVMVCYQMALLTFICSLVRIPFTASLFAYEHINWYAGLSLVECLLRLFVAIAIAYVAIDSLVFYSCAYGIVALMILIAYVIYCKSHYATCSFVKTQNKKLAWDIFSFSGWNFFGALSKVGMIQGTIVLLNIFFGPIITAAFAVATQIQNAFNSFTNAIVLAIRPAMIKSYADNQHEYLNNLFFIANKTLFYLLLLVSLPIILEMRVILEVWLGYVSSEMVLFCQLIVVYVVVLAMNNPITIIIHATGKIKRYTLSVETITLLCLPISWILFKTGAAAHWALYSMIILCVLAHIQRLICLKHEYDEISIRQYLLSFLLVGIAVAVVSYAIALTLHLYDVNIYVKVALWLICFPIVECLLFYYVGLNGEERGIVRGLIRIKKEV